MPDHTPQLRQVTAADSDLAFAIKKKSFGGYTDEVWGWDEGLQRRLHDRDFESERFQIVHLAGQDIGLLGLRAEGSSLWIGQIYILPIHQNKGYGTRLIQDVITEANQSGQSVKLQVLKINPARELYERLGFVITGTNGPHHVMEHAVSRSARPNTSVGDQ